MLAYANLLPRLRLEVIIFWDSRNDEQRDFLSAVLHLNILLRVKLPREVIAGFFVYLQDAKSVSSERRPKNRLTSRMAHLSLGSPSLILPFGKPQPDDDFHPFTSTH